MILNTGEDLTGPDINTLAIEVRKPSGAIIEWPGSELDPTKILYELMIGDLDEVGTWTIQSKVNAVTGNFKGRTASFRVKRCLQP